jgi:hypothetical protein
MRFDHRLGGRFGARRDLIAAGLIHGRRHQRRDRSADQPLSAGSRYGNYGPPTRTGFAARRKVGLSGSGDGTGQFRAPIIRSVL